MAFAVCLGRLPPLPSCLFSMYLDFLYIFYVTILRTLQTPYCDNGSLQEMVSRHNKVLRPQLLFFFLQKKKP